MTTRSSITQAGYLTQGPFTDPGALGARLSRIVDEAGSDPAALAVAVRSLMVHVHWRQAYGLPDDSRRAQAETNIRDVRSTLARIGELQVSCGRREDDLSPLPLPSRLIGNCRHHSVLFAALLRAAGVPARARCGFGRYFEPDSWVDHWVVERWEEGRWVVSDAQLDELMIEKLELDFDPLDLPAGEFISGGEAWRACRAGDDPDRYGIFEFHGWDFVRGNLVRDVASLAKRELLPWDCWGAILKPNAEMTEPERAQLDEAAQATPMQAPGELERFAGLAALPAFRVPPRIMSFSPGAQPVEVDLAAILGA